MYRLPIDKTKAIMNAPCKDNTGHYPESVLCDYDCHRCGWNPKERSADGLKSSSSERCRKLSETKTARPSRPSP